VNFQLLLCISCSRRFRSVRSETPSCNTLYHTLLQFAQGQIFSLESQDAFEESLESSLKIFIAAETACQHGSDPLPILLSPEAENCACKSISSSWAMRSGTDLKKNVRPWSYGAKWGEWDDL